MRRNNQMLIDREVAQWKCKGHILWKKRNNLARLEPQGEMESWPLRNNFAEDSLAWSEVKQLVANNVLESICGCSILQLGVMGVKKFKSQDLLDGIYDSNKSIPIRNDLRLFRPALLDEDKFCLAITAIFVHIFKIL